MTGELQAAGEAQLSGDPLAAIAILEPLCAREPGDAEARYWLASAKLTAGAPDADQAMNDARVLQALPLAQAMGADTARLRTDAAYAAAVAQELYGRHLVGLSGVVRALALAGGSLDAMGLLSYGLSLQHQGRMEEAAQIFQAVAESFPSAQAHQFLLFALLLCQDRETRYPAAAADWAQRYAPSVAAPPFGHAPRAGRKLRIGYVAPTFARSQVRQFITPVLEAHDPKAVEVTLYPAKADTEAGMWPDWIRVRPIGTLSDADAAALIRRDHIDVLSDCWGHTAGSRLPVFARRPAPVQFAWINFVQTTGLPEMDYVLHADGPESGAGEVFSEAIWRIGPVFTAFRPPSGRLDPVPTPALARGEVTFGSFLHPSKLSDWALDAWAAALRGAPNSRLLLKYSYFVDPVLQRATQARFAARGVAPERLAFEGFSTGEAYFQAFQQVDLMLDSWPAPGSTTTLDALSNGVPVLAKPTACSGGHYVRTILEASGLAELIAESPEDFVERAVALASDLPRLDALRARVRPGFEAGPICDEAGFTRRLEAACGEMFDAWRLRATARGAA
ncbi:MAG: hypothetical protein JF588_20030 [Caulobacterales bacterium]|nr:hypothetical protein [Caulobacterales bacterium]